LICGCFQEQEVIDRLMETPVKNPQVAVSFSDKIEKVTTRVVVQTVNNVIIGDFYHRPRIRLIDELISGEEFLAISNAVVYDKSGKMLFRTRFLSINRDHIVLFIPWNDMEKKQDSQLFSS
jgi:hypothetical protein